MLPFSLLSPSKAELTLLCANQELARGINQSSVLLQPEKPCCKPTREASQPVRMRKCGEPVSPLFSPFAHVAHGARSTGGERGLFALCPYCWSGEVGQGPAPGEMVLPRAGIIGCWGCPLRHGGDRPAVGTGGCCDPRPTVGPVELLHVPLPAVHPTALCIQRSSSLPQGRCLSDYPIYQVFICENHFHNPLQSPPFSHLSIQLTSPLSSLTLKGHGKQFAPSFFADTFCILRTSFTSSFSFSCMSETQLFPQSCHLLSVQQLSLSSLL